MMTDDEKFNEALHDLIEEMPDVPEPPREEMWARIDAERRERRGQGNRFTQRTRWTMAGMGLAAMLTLGIGLGRFMQQPEQPLTPQEIIAGIDNERSNDAALPYRLAALQHLTRSEALLAAYLTDARAGRTQEVAKWAQDLLTNTRLLRDSPAAQDAEIARLLDDLELALAQIANLSDAPEGELDMIQEGIDQNNVMLRLRAVTAAPTTGI